MEETGTNSSFFIGGAGAGAIDDSGGQNSNFTNNIAWDNWDNNIISVTSHAAATPNNDLCLLFFNSAFNNNNNDNNNNNNNSDPHIMCLKLGKRDYCEGPVVVPDRHVMVAESSSSTVTKRGKPPYHPYDTFVATAGVRVASTTRCQVEGCHVALGNVKEYYRRHKVCEIHSKAPKVVVSGLLQRFCQQCSRFHDITEFDDTKRSCRRRLQGHNLRRRKGTISNSLPRNFQHSLENNSVMERHLGPLSTLPSPSSSSKSKPVRALSLLSSPKADPWISSSDLSSRCSAALHELIAANRATFNSGHFLNPNSSPQPIIDDTMHTSQDTDRSSRTTTALDVKQASALDFGLLAMKEPKGQEECTDYCWSALGGANVV